MPDYYGLPPRYSESANYSININRHLQVTNGYQHERISIGTYQSFERIIASPPEKSPSHPPQQSAVRLSPEPVRQAPEKSKELPPLSKLKRFSRGAVKFCILLIQGLMISLIVEMTLQCLSRVLVNQ